MRAGGQAPRRLDHERDDALVGDWVGGWVGERVACAPDVVGPSTEDDRFRRFKRLQLLRRSDTTAMPAQLCHRALRAEQRAVCVAECKLCVQSQRTPARNRLSTSPVWSPEIPRASVLYALS